MVPLFAVPSPPDPVRVARSGDRIVVTLRGLLDSAVGAALDDRLRAAPWEEGDRLLIDLREVTDFNEAGAARLLRTHGALVAVRPCRSAYLTDRPRLRALIFKIIHGTQDKNTRPVASLTAADAWLREASGQAFADVSLDRARTLLGRLQERLRDRRSTQ